MSVEYYRKRLIDLRKDVSDEREAKKETMHTMPISSSVPPRPAARPVTANRKSSVPPATTAASKASNATLKGPRTTSSANVRELNENKRNNALICE